MGLRRVSFFGPWDLAVQGLFECLGCPVSGRSGSRVFRASRVL